MRSMLSVIIIIALSTYYKGYTQTSLTLKQCVDNALSNNPVVKQSDLQILNGSLNLKQAKNNQLPDLIANLNHGIDQGRSIDPFTNGYVNQNISYGNYSLGTSISIFNGFELKNLVKENQLLYEADKMDLQQVKDNLTLNVILAYLTVLSNEDLLQQSQAQVILSGVEVDRLAILDKQGAIIPAQLYDLRGQLANDQLSVINIQNALESAKISLCQLMNIPYDRTIRIERLSADEYAMEYESDPAKIYQVAVTRLSIVKAAELRKQGAITAVKVANGEFYPHVSLGAGLNTNYSSAAKKDILLNTVQVPSGDYVTVGGSQVPVFTTKNNYYSQQVQYFDQFKNNYSTSMNLNVRIPLLNAFQARNKVVLAKNDVKNNEYLEAIIKNNLRQEIDQAYVNMSSAATRYKTLLQQVNDFSQSFHSAEVRFNAGASTQVEYLIAKNNSDRAQINLISSKYDYILRRKILDYYREF